MLEFVEHLFTYQFLNRALITSIIVGIVCGTVGSLIVLRGLSLMGDAMSHAVLPGVAFIILIWYSNVYRRTYNWYDRKYFYRLYHI